MNFASAVNALKYHWCETSLLSQAVLKHVRFYLQEVFARDWFCSLKKSMALSYIKSFSCHVTVLLKRKLQHVCHKWVMGHIRIVLWAIGSNGSTGATHFQPWFTVAISLSVVHIAVYNFNAIMHVAK